MNFSRLGQRFAPLAGLEIAAAQPHQCQNLYSLVVVQCIECGGQFLSRRIVTRVFEDRDVVVIGGI